MAAWLIILFFLLIFLGDAENEAKAAILVLSILINRSYFLLNALKSGIYRFSASASLIGIVYWHVRSKPILSLIFYYWHLTYWKQLCQICRHFVSLHQPRGV